MFSKMWIKPSTSDCSGQINQLKQALQRADAVVIGAGAGLSTSAGFTYTPEAASPNIFLILKTHMDFTTCILVVFIPLVR